MTTASVGRPILRLKCAVVQVVLESQCCASKKWRWPNQLKFFCLVVLRSEAKLIQATLRNRDEEWEGSTTPTSRSARNHAIWTSFFFSYWKSLFSKLSDGTSETSNLRTGSLKIPRLSGLKVNFKTEVWVNLPSPTSTMSWIKEAEMAKSVDDLLPSQSIEGHEFHDFDMLDAKIASALKRIITNQYFRRRTNVEEQQAHQFNRFLQKKLHKSVV